MAEVFLCERGQLDNRSKRDLRAVGVVVVEVEDPAKCQFIRSTEVVGQDDMLWAVFDALRHRAVYGSDQVKEQNEKLAANLFGLVLGARAKKPGKGTQKDETP